jgi:predicted nucleotidyltransferase
MPPELPVLGEEERACLDEYVGTLRERLGRRLLEVRLFGSVARGESWPAGMPIRSDLDLLVVTEEPLAEAEVEALVAQTYPLFLRCGRQLAPQFRTPAQLAAPRDEQAARFAEEVERDCVVLWRRERPG